MTGRWIDAIARRLLRPSSYDTIAVPAIADLQFEAGGGWLATVRAYAGVWRAIAFGALSDAAVDAHVAFGGRSLITVWLPSIAWAAAFAALPLVLGFFEDPRPRDAVLPAVAIAAALRTISWTMVPAAFLFARRQLGGLRTMAAAIAVIATITWIAAFAIRPTRDRAQARMQTVIVQTVMEDAARVSGHWAAGRPRHEVARMIRSGSPPAPNYGFWSDVRLGLSVPVLALVGVTLASGRGWTVALQLLLIAAATLAFSWGRVLLPFSARVPIGHQGWFDLIALLYAVLILRAWGRTRTPRPA